MYSSLILIYTYKYSKLNFLRSHPLILIISKCSSTHSRSRLSCPRHVSFLAPI
jgi:hypothetical protein